MGSVAQGETVSLTNPLVFFAYQQDGKLYDVVSLKRSVYEIPLSGSPVQKVAEGALDLNATRVSQGVYHADFTATSFTIGTHEVRWKYIFRGSGPEIEVRQRFEVLDPTLFWSGRSYVGYASTIDLMRETIFAAKTASELQTIIDDQSRTIELWTGRFFEPRFQIQKLNAHSTRGLEIGDPIIGVSRVQIESGVTGTDVTLGDVDINSLRVYARHLDGVLDPDDRDDPRIEVERFEGLLFNSFQFFPSAPQGTWVTGVFGYTDPNGTPWGMTPRNLTRVIGHLAIQRLTDPFGQSITTINPFAVQSARTRDQSVTYRSGGGSTTSKSGGSTGTAAYGGLTGNDFVDRLLIPYLRPIHKAAV